MKNRPFIKRLGFAWKGIASAWRTEASFRTQGFAGIGAIVMLVVFRAAPVWWAIFALTITGVLAAELFNTALEKIMDRLHPNQDPLIALAKDCAAGAVLLLSISAVLVGAIMVWDSYFRVVIL